MTQKAAQFVQKDAFKHKLMRSLKELGGPFTCEEEVDRYMESRAEDKQKRLKMEIQFLRATSKLLSHNDTMFRIMETKDGGKRHTRSPESFAGSLRLYYGKGVDQGAHEVDTTELFRKVLMKM